MIYNQSQNLLPLKIEKNWIPLGIIISLSICQA